MATIRKDAPGFNNVQFQFADVELIFPGNRTFTQVNKLAYSVKVAREEARGTSPLPQGVTRGQYTYECSLSINRAFRQDFVNLVDSSGQGLFETFIVMTASYAHPQKNAVETDTLYIMINELNFDTSAGPAVQTLDIPCYCGYIQLNSGGNFIVQDASFTY